MPESGNCLFCGIIEGDIPSTKVRETERFYAFRDIDPQAPVHILAIPKQHFASLEEADDPGLLGDLMLFVRDLAQEEGLTEGGYRVVFNTNSQGGQTVFHLHAHLLGGRFMRWPPG